jgi:hypothetical protein
MAMHQSILYLCCRTNREEDKQRYERRFNH